MASVALPCGNRHQRIPSTVAVENVQCLGHQRSRQEESSGQTEPSRRKGIQLVVDEERGEELEAYHQHVVSDQYCGPAAWRVSGD
ncbi:hypothetical protein DPMN_098778 [Dreissena polymorpha]|uniref:Uncharacterized protein n=1 Tax=Dreissena polymorpha TaxID=45954 RepID=A0A9D4LDP7_DREPO|nr:hypothetical protein DPMN_098778 [Dreissena polymorpha]